VSLDKTLKIRLGSSRTRNVLTRGERIARLQEEDRFAPGRSPLGLPKVRVQKALSRQNCPRKLQISSPRSPQGNRGSLLY